MSAYSTHALRVMKLYRHALKNLQNWTVHRDLFVERGFQMRADFDKNKFVKDPRLVEKLVSDGEAKLAEMAHPDPYTCARRTAALRAALPPSSRRRSADAPALDGSPTHSPPCPLLAPAVPHMPGGSKYQRHPANGMGPGDIINRIPSYLQ